MSAKSQSGAPRTISRIRRNVGKKEILFLLCQSGQAVSLAMLLGTRKVSFSATPNAWIPVFTGMTGIGVDLRWTNSDLMILFKSDRANFDCYRGTSTWASSD